MSRSGARALRQRQKSAGAKLVELVQAAVDPQLSGIERIGAARAARDELDRAEAAAFAAARRAGSSWQEIADGTGMRRSGAQMRSAALSERFPTRSPRTPSERS